MSLAHGIRRRPEGGITVRLTTREREVLATLPDQLRPVLRGEGGPPGLYDRLFPSAYDDAEAEREYRELVGDDICTERLAKLDAFAETLEGGQTKRLTWTKDLDDDEAHAWLSAVNDARLVLAAVLGIFREGDWERLPEKGSPPSVVLWYLGWLEEQLVEALTTSLPPSVEEG